MEPLFVDTAFMDGVLLYNYDIYQQSTVYLPQDAPEQQEQQQRTNSALQSVDCAGDFSCFPIETISEEELSQWLNTDAVQYHELEPVARVSRVLAFDEEGSRDSGSFQDPGITDGVDSSKPAEIPDREEEHTAVEQLPVDEWMFDLLKPRNRKANPADTEVLVVNAEQYSKVPQPMAVEPALPDPLDPHPSALVCEPCGGRNFGSQSDLTQHVQAHHFGPREHRCEDCGKRFRTLEQLHRHVQRHVIRDKPFKCSGCPRQFNYEFDLRRHIATRHGQSRHACKDCGKRFGRQDYLVKHEAVHDRRRRLYGEEPAAMGRESV